MSDDPMTALRAAYVTQMQRAHAQRTRGIATPEQRQAWHDEANRLIAAHDEQVRAEERERIAKAIDECWNGSQMSEWGYQNALPDWRMGMADAARIARQGGSDGDRL